jgi:hypothetical protein
MRRSREGRRPPLLLTARPGQFSLASAQNRARLPLPMGTVCSIAGCGNPVVRRGFCWHHEQRWVGQKVCSQKVCSVSDCHHPVIARRFCGRHYYRWRRYGDPQVYVLPRASSRVCSVADCGHPPIARGFCWRHYQRWRRHGDPLIFLRRGNRFVASVRLQGHDRRPLDRPLYLPPLPLSATLLPFIPQGMETPFEH